MAATPKQPGIKRGGAQPGAGRPRKIDAHATPIKDAEKRICDRLPQLLDNLFKLADGVTVQDSEEDEVYRKPPDIKALIYLVDRVMGKAAQPIVGDESRAGLSITVQYTDIEPLQ